MEAKMVHGAAGAARFATLLLVAVGCMAAPLSAWDEVSHAHIGDLAIDLVEDEELRRILTENRGLVRFGTWFPDWGQYAGKHPFNEGSHREVVAAYLDYVSRTDVRSQPNWERLVAHAFGAYAHSVMDFFMDSTMYKYLRELDTGMSGDMENGILYIRRFGYLGVTVDPSYPYDDLRRMYASIGYFERDGLDPAAFRSQIDRHTKGQFLQMRGLKLLSFLASNYIESRMPWAAQHAYDAPGGHRDNAVAVAKTWDALWDSMHERPAAFFVHSLPAPGEKLPTADNESRYGRISLLAREALDPDAVASALVLLDAQDRIVPGRTSVYAYDEDDAYDSYADLVLQFIPERPLVPGGAYTLHVMPGDYALREPAYSASFALPIVVAAEEDTSSEPRSQGFRMGVFLLLLVGGIGALLFGASGAVATATTSSKIPTILVVIRRVLETVGVLFFLAGVVLFFTKGAPFVRLLLDIF